MIGNLIKTAFLTALVGVMPLQSSDIKVASKDNLNNYLYYSYQLSDGSSTGFNVSGGYHIYNLYDSTYGEFSTTGGAFESLTNLYNNGYQLTSNNPLACGYYSVSSYTYLGGGQYKLFYDSYFYCFALPYYTDSSRSTLTYVDAMKIDFNIYYNTIDTNGLTFSDLFNVVSYGGYSLQLSDSPTSDVVNETHYYCWFNTPIIYQGIVSDSNNDHSFNPLFFSTSLHLESRALTSSEYSNYDSSAFFDGCVTDVDLICDYKSVLQGNNFADGYNDGYSDGYDNGNADGYNQGYSDGLSLSGNASFMSLFNAIADTPLRFLYGMFSFDLFGVSVLIIILTLVTAIVVFGIVKKFVK